METKTQSRDILEFLKHISIIYPFKLFLGHPVYEFDNYDIKNKAR